jgi:bifunctional non-homologous end joining protein LigD
MPAVKAATRTKRAQRRDSESTPTLPAFRPPQKAELRDALPEGDEWLFEIKYDGYRAEAAIAGDEVHIYSSSGADWSNKQFAWLVPHFRGLTGSLLIDGEICALDERGRPDFSLLKVSLDGRSPLVFIAFDLLEQDGEDLTGLPLLERKGRLEAIFNTLPAGSPIRYSWHVLGNGEAMMQAMREHGMEGVLAKRAGSRYVPSDRSGSWQKIKTVMRQEFVVIGWRPPEFGADDVRGLFLATYENGELIYRGGVGTGFTDRMRREVLKDLRQIRTDERPPVKGMPRAEMKVARWVEPIRLAEVEFRQVTPDGTLRHPSFKGLRYDKPAAEVHLEEPEHAMA